MKNIILLLSLTVALSGCASAVVIGAAAGASVMHDRRTTGSIVEDENIEIKAAQAIRKDEAIYAKANINVISFNSRVLIAGQAATPEIKSAVETKVSKIEKVNKVHNEVRIAAPSSTLTRSSDVWITSRVKLMMVAEKDLDANHIKVFTENGEVFLLGLVSKEEAARAIAVTRTVSGVQRVVELFEYIPPNSG